MTTDALPRVTLRRRLDWMDTDAADRWHYSVLFRWAEEGEAALHRELGIVDRTFGATPRVAVDATYSAAVTFDDEVEIDFWVARLGTTSVTYEFRIRLVEADVEAGAGTVVTVFTAEDGTKAPWPEDLRTALGGG